MRRTRRGGGLGTEFGSSGEDSFVAVVVTKLTGALLFILLLTMVIMALLPKAVDLNQAQRSTAETGSEPRPKLTITTPETLPDAIAGRPYRLALAASGVSGTPRWTILGPRPDWLSIDEETGQLRGTPKEPKSSLDPFVVKVADRTASATQAIRLSVLAASEPRSFLSWAANAGRGVPWQAWAEQGVGFLLLWLIHLIGMNAIASLERKSMATLSLATNLTPHLASSRRFAVYRLIVRACTMSLALGLAGWLLLTAVPDR